MSTLKNSVQLIGHLGADPEIKTLESGAKVARIRIATTDSYKNKNGEWVDETTWHTIVAWEALAERAERNLHKGSYVLIEGKLTNRNYVTKEGDKKYVYEVRAVSILPLDKKEKEAASPALEEEGSSNNSPF